MSVVSVHKNLSILIYIVLVQLKSKATIVTIDNLYLLAVPAAEKKYDPEEEERRFQAGKQDRLKNSEILNTGGSSTMTEEEAQKSQSFVESITQRVLDNLQVTVRLYSTLYHYLVLTRYE